MIKKLWIILLVKFSKRYMKIKNEKYLARFYQSLVGKFILLNETNEETGMAVGGIAQIDKSDIDNLNKAYDILNEFTLFKRKVEEIRLNYEAFFETKEYWTEKVRKAPGQKSTALQEQVYIDVNRRLKNYIVSLKSLIDDLLVKKYIPKIFGNPSTELEEFKQQNSQWYDTIFEYKLLLRLRDYAVHSDMPIQIVHFDYDFDKDRTPDIELVLTPKFRKSTLLANKELRNKCGTELKGYPDEIEVEPILKQTEFIFEDILKLILKISGDRYTKPVNYMKTQIAKVKNPVTVSFGTVTMDGDKVGPQTNIINQDTMNLIEKLGQQK